MTSVHVPRAGIALALSLLGLVGTPARGDITIKAVTLAFVALEATVPVPSTLTILKRSGTEAPPPVPANDLIILEPRADGIAAWFITCSEEDETDRYYAALGPTGLGGIAVLRVHVHLGPTIADDSVGYTAIGENLGGPCGAGNVEMWPANSVSIGVGIG